MRFDIPYSTQLVGTHVELRYIKIDTVCPVSATSYIRIKLVMCTSIGVIYP